MRANGQQAVACFIWDERSGVFEGRILDVLTFRGARITAVTAFIDPTLFPRFGLPESLEGIP